MKLTNLRVSNARSEDCHEYATFTFDLMDGGKNRGTAEIDCCLYDFSNKYRAEMDRQHAENKAFNELFHKQLDKLNNGEEITLTVSKSEDTYKLEK